MSQLDPQRQKLVDRILKLLALASSSTFAGEAANARRMAEELIGKHNVDLGPGKPSQDTMEVRSYVPFAKGMNWELMIAVALGNLCTCAVYFGDALDHFTLAGTIWNLDCLEYMVREVNRQRIAAWMEYKAQRKPDSFNKFCYGFAQALESKIDAITRGRMAWKPPINLWYEHNILHKPLVNQDFHMGRATSDAGLAAGKGASLHRGALGTPTKLLR